MVLLYYVKASTRDVEFDSNNIWHWQTQLGIEVQLQRHISLAAMHLFTSREMVVWGILANSLHFFFTAMKRWKFWNHCNECDEFAMKKRLFSSGKFAKNWNFKENHKKRFFLFKIKIFLDLKLWKNPKNSKNQAKIDNAMNFSSSLRWIFIAKIFFTAMNSLLVSQCSLHQIWLDTECNIQKIYGVTLCLVLWNTV